MNVCCPPPPHPPPVSPPEQVLLRQSRPALDPGAAQHTLQIQPPFGQLRLRSVHPSAGSQHLFSEVRSPDQRGGRGEFHFFSVVRLKPSDTGNVYVDKTEARVICQGQRPISTGWMRRQDKSGPFVGQILVHRNIQN